MVIIKRKYSLGWEISILEFRNHIGKKYKITRRFPDLSISETKIFKTKEEAQKQIKEWLK